MRNLKKILALALALVMSLSLMATANAFTDDDSITDTYETAVTVLSGLKVFQGYDDGTFQPKGAITRAEVAAIIYRIVTGDVADTQVGIYADYNKFDDVASTSWYAGYVNFCANAEYIKGYDARTFGPNDPVTGYQALAMILRALGYDKNGEFTGTNWTIQTAAVGEQRGITKNITAGTLGVPATREVVAEILFRAILVPKATYTPAFGYQTSVNGVENTSIGWDTFELEDITGVVVANEYADLYSASPMDEGETELDVDGESYTLAYATTVEDLGEARHAYVTGETVLAIADAGNTVWTNEGAETDIATSSKCEDVAGLERDDTTEEYINFANETYEYVTDIRVSYWLDTNENQVKDADDETGMFRKDHKLTADEVEILEGIFKDDDKMDGWVVVGTKELSEPNDISDDITWREFCREYFQDTDALIEEVNGADNGEWLKVIDNDGDGVADYIFRIDFAMSVIERISKDNEYTLASLDDNDDEVSFQDTKIDGGDIATEDELAEGDVVLYTYIDGVYYMSIAEMVTETVDARGINSKTETMTCNGTDYVQSHIGYTDESEYYYDVTDAHTEVTYDLYLDHFGYVRLFIESDYDTFVLLTDGWYEDDNRNTTFRAMFWNVEDGEEQEINITDNDDADQFIYTTRAGEVETWGNLQGAEMTYLDAAYAHPNKYATNIAGYSATDDGYTLKSVESSAERIDYEVQALVGNDLHDSLKARVMEGSYYGWKNGAVGDYTSRIQTNTNTQYYLVIRDEASRYTANGWVVEDVLTWTGYANAPEEAKLVEDATVGYAVTHKTSTDGDYYVADVVVFETAPYADRDTFFVYEHNNHYVEYVWGLGYNAEGAIEDQRVDVEDGDNVIWNHGKIEFYRIFDNQKVEYIGSNYAANNIYAGVVDTDWDLEDVDYIQVNDTAAGYLYIMADAPIYKVMWDSDEQEYSVDTIDRDDVSSGDKMILFTDNDENVEYAISVDASVYDYDYDGNGLKDDILLSLYDTRARIVANYGLWNRIMDDAEPVPYDEMLDAAMLAAKNALAMPESTVAERAAKLAALQAAWSELKDLSEDADAMASFTNTEKLALGAMMSDLNDAIMALGDIAEDEQTAQEAVAALNAAWEAFDNAAAADKEAAREALAEALLNYNKLEPTMTAEQKEAAELNKAKAENEIETYVEGAGKPNAASASTFVQIEAANEKAVALKGSKLLEAYKALPSDVADKAIDDDIAAAEEKYAEAAPQVALMAALVEAYENDQLLNTDASEAALVAAYQAVNEAELGDCTAAGQPSWDLLTSDSEPAYTDYQTAYNAAATIAATADSAMIQEAKEAINEWLKKNAWEPIVGENLDMDDFNAAIKDQVMDVLEAADVSGVTVTINNGSWTTIPAVGSEADEVYFQIQLTAGAGTRLEVNEQTVKVINNHTEASIKAAVKAKIGNAASKGTYTSWNLLKAKIAELINEVPGVTEGTVLNDVTDFAVDKVLTVEYSFVYNGETYKDNTTLTLVA